MGNGTTDTAIIGLAGSTWTKYSKRSTETAKAFFISGISWGDGDRLVTSFTTTADPTKAVRLRTKRAIKVAAYLRDCGKSPFVTA